MVRAPASQSVDLGLNSLVESYQKPLKNSIHTFRAGARHLWEVVENKPASTLIVSLGKVLDRTPAFMWKTGIPDTTETATPKRVRRSRPKYSNTICFLVNGG